MAKEGGIQSCGGGDGRGEESWRDYIYILSLFFIYVINNVDRTHKESNTNK